MADDDNITVALPTVPANADASVFSGVVSGGTQDINTGNGAIAFRSPPPKPKPEVKKPADEFPAPASVVGPAIGRKGREVVKRKRRRKTATAAIAASTPGVTRPASTAYGSDEVDPDDVTYDDPADSEAGQPEQSSDGHSISINISSAELGALVQNTVEKTIAEYKAQIQLDVINAEKDGGKKAEDEFGINIPSETRTGKVTIGDNLIVYAFEFLKYYKFDDFFVLVLKPDTFKISANPTTSVVLDVQDGLTPVRGVFLGSPFRLESKFPYELLIFLCEPSNDENEGEKRNL